MSLQSCLQQDAQLGYVHNLHSSGIKSFSVEVDYMRDAQPEIRLTQQNLDVWDLFEGNIKSFFTQDLLVTVPKNLESMQEIPSQNKNYNKSDIEALAIEYRNNKVFDGDTASLYVLFLDGFFLDDDGDVQQSILGVSLPGKAMLVVFNSAVQMGTVNFPQLLPFTQQLVLIHEVGHSLGLVDNGIPLRSDHLDTNEGHGGAHCNNPNCIMYWRNDGFAHTLFSQVELGSQLNHLVLFGAECMSDISAFHQ